jgi:hypothetical protein
MLKYDVTLDGNKTNDILEAVVFLKKDGRQFTNLLYVRHTAVFCTSSILKFPETLDHRHAHY